MRIPSYRQRSKAFTLVELLVVVAIISVLAALLMPALRGALKEARKALCQNNLRQLFLLGNSYADDYRGQMVPIAYSPDGPKLGYKWPANLQDNYGVSDTGLFRCPEFVGDMPSTGTAYGLSGAVANASSPNSATEDYPYDNWHHPRTSITRFDRPSQTGLFMDYPNYCFGAPYGFTTVPGYSPYGPLSDGDAQLRGMRHQTGGRDDQPGGAPGWTNYHPYYGGFRAAVVYLDGHTGYGFIGWKRDPNRGPESLDYLYYGYSGSAPWE